jgi:hypothetical protein
MISKMLTAVQSFYAVVAVVVAVVVRDLMKSTNNSNFIMVIFAVQLEGIWGMIAWYHCLFKKTHLNR